MQWVWNIKCEDVDEKGHPYTTQHTQENSHLKVYQPKKKGKKEKEIKFIITHDMSAHNTEKREKMSFKFTNKKKEIIEKKRDNNKSFELGIGARMHALRIFIEKHKKKFLHHQKKNK